MSSLNGILLSERALQGGVTSQRYEMKYIVSPYQAELVRQSITPFTIPDPKAKFGHRYPLSSVYLDSQNLSLFWSSALGENKRFKLRVRTYTEDAKEPVFFEIKSRHNGIVMKKRAVVDKGWVGRLLEGHRPTPEVLLSSDPLEYENLETFRYLMEVLGAVPRIHVRYMREAYMSRDNDPVRITFDSDIACLPSVGPIQKIRLNGRGWCPLPGDFQIVEIKFTDSYPAWIQEMVQRLSLTRDSYAKYVSCVQLLKSEGYDIKHPVLLEGTPNGWAG